jgi:LPS O-antigen subunit length determinant protein (WzzB/FepE family)
MKKIDFKNFSAVDVIEFAWEKRVPLIVISIIAAIISIIASFMITPLFKSEVVVFPAPNISTSKSLLSKSFTSRTGLLNFGEEETGSELAQQCRFGFAAANFSKLEESLS